MINMEGGKILLLSQLMASFDENFLSFKNAYDAKDKESFDKSKKALLEIQHRIDYLLKLK